VGGLVVGVLLLALPEMFGVGYPVMFRALDGHYAVRFLLLLLVGKIVATSLTLGVGGSGGVFAPSLFVGLMAGTAYGVGARDLVGATAGPPALYAAVGMAAVFASSTRAPLTALASVVEMTGAYGLTLPVMLAVALATVVSRAVSYGTIYTTKLLRRGQDIERTAPWRSFGTLTAQDVMRPSQRHLELPTEPPAAALDAVVVERREPHAVFASESVVEVLRHLQHEGREAVPVVSENGRELVGWATGRSIARAIAHRLSITTSSVGGSDPGRSTLPEHHVLEVAIDGRGAGLRVVELGWPDGYLPVSITRDGRYREARPDVVLREGDLVGLIARGRARGDA
jgi:CIC family chloride channel protein